MSNRLSVDRAMILGMSPEQRHDLEAYYAGTDQFADSARKALGVTLPRFDTDCEFVWAYLGHCRAYFEDERKVMGLGNTRAAMSDLNVLVRAIQAVRGIIAAQTDFGLRVKLEPVVPIKDRLEKTILTGEGPEC